VVKKFLYSINVIFRKFNPSPIVMQGESDDKKLEVQLPPKTKKVEPKNEPEFHVRLNEEESLESSKEEVETPLQPLRRSTWKRRQLDNYTYIPSNFKCIFSLSINTNEPRTMKKEIEMENSEP